MIKAEERHWFDIKVLQWNLYQIVVLDLNLYSWKPEIKDMVM